MSHRCHAIGCEKPVPPKMLMCLKHWRMVPAENQRNIWATYRPGQESDKGPSLLYLVNQRLACAAVAEKEGKSAEAEKAREQAAQFAERMMRTTLCECGATAWDHAQPSQEFDHKFKRALGPSPSPGAEGR